MSLIGVTWRSLVNLQAAKLPEYSLWLLTAFISPGQGRVLLLSLIFLPASRENVFESSLVRVLVGIIAAILIARWQQLHHAQSSTTSVNLISYNICEFLIWKSCCCSNSSSKWWQHGWTEIKHIQNNIKNWLLWNTYKMKTVGIGSQSSLSKDWGGREVQQILSILMLLRSESLARARLGLKNHWPCSYLRLASVCRLICLFYLLFMCMSIFPACM